MRWHDDSTTVELPAVTTYYTAIANLCGRICNNRHKLSPFKATSIDRRNFCSRKPGKMPCCLHQPRNSNLTDQIEYQPQTNYLRRSCFRCEKGTIKTKCSHDERHFRFAPLAFPVSLVDRSLAIIDVKTLVQTSYIVH